MRKWAWGLLVLPFVWWLTQAQPVQAATLPARPAEHYYYDDDLHLLDDQTQQLIDKKNQYYQTTKQKPQIGVAVVRSTGGDAIGQYAPDLFSKWGIGNKSRDNGVLIVFAKNGGKNNMRIEVGYGLESNLTDALAGRILNQNLTNIKSGNAAKTNQALRKVFNAVATVIDKQYKFPKDANTVSMTQYQTQTATQRDSDSGGSGWFGAIIKIIIAVIVVIIIIASIGGGGGGGRGRRGRGGDSWWLWWLLGSLLSGGRGPRGGGGWGSGGGFGGGGSDWGGGSSGGGGADV